MPNYINQDKFPRELALHQKYAPNAMMLNLVWGHCNVITDVVIQLYEAKPDQYDFPLAVAVQAALLHDIGVYFVSGFEWIPGQPSFSAPYAQHTVIGAWVLYQEGYLPEVVQAADLHAGVGLTKDDITTHQLQVPVDDYVPKNVFQQLITYAAKFHSKTPKFKTVDDVRKTLQQFSEEKAATFDQYVNFFGQPDLKKIEEKYQEWHKAFMFETEKLTKPQQAGFSSAGISKVSENLPANTLTKS